MDKQNIDYILKKLLINDDVCEINNIIHDNNNSEYFSHIYKFLEKYRNNGTVLTVLGNLYKSGIYVEKDITTARELYERASNLGSGSGTNYLASLYHSGIGVKQNLTKAMELYQKASEQGNTYALNNLAFMYDNGEGCPVDNEKAMELYKKSADLGNSYAMNNIGFHYLTGISCEKDYVFAKKYFEKAANLGNEAANNNLIKLYGQLYKHEHQIVENDRSGVENPKLSLIDKLKKHLTLKKQFTYQKLSEQHHILNDD